MLDTFEDWGLPKAIRSDNGEPFGCPTRDVIPFMSLWLKAWGIQPIINRPKQPQDNAHVENNQHTASRWAEVYQCESVQQMQKQLDEAARFQRDVYLVRRIGNVSRKQVFPGLYQKTRPFNKASFDQRKAHEFLAQAIYPRLVSSGGAISLYNKKFQAGFQHRKELLWIKFDPKNLCWLCLNKDRNIVRTLAEQRLERQNLYVLNLCQ